MTLILLIITAATAITALFRPWIGVCAYYLIAILSPRYIWPWIFADYPISKVLAVASLIGFFIGITTKKINAQNFLDKHIYFLVASTLLIFLSDIMSPFTDRPMPGDMIHPSFILDLLKVIIIIHICTIITIDSTKKLYIFSWMLIITAIYMAYWANSAYFSGDIYLYNHDGRLRGPGGIFTDTNSFGLLFIVSTPFFIFLGLHTKKTWQRYMLWGSIPFIWNSAFLTGSRGALLALCITTVFIAYQLKSKKFSLLLIILVGGAIASQAGNIINRASDTVANNELNGAKPIDPRIVSWQVGFKIIKDYPLLGAGTGRFQQASPEYTNAYSYVAHNTFLQYSANSGILVGILYLLIYYNILKDNRKHPTQRLYNANKTASNYTLLGLRRASNASLVAYFTGSIFLDLMLWEAVYSCLVVAIVSRRITIEETNKLPSGHLPL